MNPSKQYLYFLRYDFQDYGKSVYEIGVSDDCKKCATRLERSFAETVRGDRADGDLSLCYVFYREQDCCELEHAIRKYFKNCGGVRTRFHGHKHCGDYDSYWIYESDDIERDVVAFCKRYCLELYPREQN